MSAAPASPTSPGSTSSLEYTRGPEPRSTKVLLITVVVIAMVLALAAASWVWSALGGVAHTATDSTVSAVRAKAIPTVEGDVERIVTVLAPTMGGPALRAVVDECGGSTTNISTNDIGCRRTYFLYYPTTAEPPLASVVAKLLADDDQTAVWGSDDRRGFPTQSSVPKYRSGGVSVESTSADVAHYVFCGPRVTSEMVVVNEGCSEILAAASTGANVVVEYSASYFVG